MTCHYTNTHWRDALYNAVRATNGGVDAAATFLTTRRDRAMHPQSLGRKLRGGDSLDVELALLLAEYVRIDADARPQANTWLLSLCAQEGLHVDDVPPAPAGGWACEAKALQAKFLELAAVMGEVAAATAQTTADSKIEQHEADVLVPKLREIRVMSHRMERNVMRAVAKGSDK